MRITIGISGSIAAYKIIDLAKDFKKQGHSVTVLLSEGAKNFTNKKIFSYFNIPVFDTADDFNANGVKHIKIAKKTDLFLLAPMSAHTLAKISNGLADDIISTCFLALDKKIKKVLIPAMNTKMLENEITQENLNKINKLKNLMIYPSANGLLACGDIGSGKLPELKELMELIPLLNYNKKNKSVIITAGATLAPLDSIRYLTNPAKGATAYLLAKKFLSKGYKVHIIKGKYATRQLLYLRNHPLYTEETVISTNDLLKSVKTNKADIYISPMAVSDIQFKLSGSKLKKSSLEDSIEISVAPDVLKYALESKKFDTVVGFGAESSLSEDVIKEKINRKPVDLLVMNSADGGLLNKKAKGFSGKSNDYILLNKSGKILAKGELSKIQLVEKIYKFVKDYCCESN